jgi:DNA-binding CsgD family transcriptional regulator
LTPRQKDILCLIAEDLTAKEIADELSISPKTVEFHKEILRKKIGKVGTAGLVRFAIRNGLVEA